MAVRGGLVFAAVVATGLGAWFVWGTAPRTATPPRPPVSTTTAPVTRGDVVRRVTVEGTLGYDGHYQVVSQLPAGVVTMLPAPGTVVSRGGRLFAVSGNAAVLFYGAVPAYRDFAAGMTDGADVRELEENLVALGADPNHAIRVDDHFTSATAAAIQRWQAATGVPAAAQTPTLPLGRVVFLPAAVRVGEVTAGVGGSVAPGGPVLSATSTTSVVIARVGTDQQHLVHVGDEVQVQLPVGAPMTGRVTDISRVVASPDAGGQNPTVAVTVALSQPPAAGDLDQAPAQVQITVEQHHDVLMVPVTALVSVAGGYQVIVVDNGTRRPLPVQPGLYDDRAGTVEVTGSGLAEAMMVEVPAA